MTDNIGESAVLNAMIVRVLHGEYIPLLEFSRVCSDVDQRYADVLWRNSFEVWGIVDGIVTGTIPPQPDGRHHEKYFTDQIPISIFVADAWRISQLEGNMPLAFLGKPPWDQGYPAEGRWYTGKNAERAFRYPMTKRSDLRPGDVESRSISKITPAGYISDRPLW